MLVYAIGGVMFFLLIYALLSLRGVPDALNLALYPFLAYQALLLVVHLTGTCFDRKKRRNLR